jgi:general secretion pathway protein D
MRIHRESRLLISLLLTFSLLLLPATAFAKKGDKNFKAGMRYENAQQWEKAAQEFTLALAADPANLEYQLHFRRASFNASQAYMQQGRALAEQHDFVGAYNAFRMAYSYDPVNELAVSEMERMLRLQGVKDGTSATKETTTTRTGELLDGNLAPATAQEEAALPAPRVEQMRVISYSGDLKAFIRSLAEQLNLNVVFDRQSFVQPRTIDINLRDVTTSQALDYIFLQEGLFFQKLSRRTILVADQTRRPQYQQLVLRTFFLANTDPDKAKTLVGQAIPPSVGRPQTIVVPDKDTNSLTIRDTAENVRLIGELLQSIDKDRAEVVMDVNIYEVSKNDMLQLGNQLGTDNTLTLGGSPGLAVLTSNGTVDRLRTGVNLASIVGGVPTAAAAALVIPPSVLTAFQSKSNTKLIASTQVHAFNGEESSARIGQRVPVQTAQAYPFGVQTSTGTTNNGFPTGGFPVINYEPTGLTLKFTPQVFPNQDVQVKMSIESKDVLGASTLTPTFTERTITGTARVQNNRTMMLASVSQDVQTNGRRGLPVLGGLPIVGRLFSSPTRDNRQVDIVIAVTPRVLRAPAITPRDEEMRPSGTLQSPTTGSLEAMLREAEREDQLAQLRLQKRNAAAHANETTASAAPAINTPAANGPSSANVAVNNPVVTPQTDATNPTVASAVPAKEPIIQPSMAPASQVSQTQTAPEDLPAYVPAPKSLVSNQAASAVAAVNTNLNNDARAVLTSNPKPVDAAIRSVSSRSKIAQLKLSPAEETMKAGEKRQFSLELKSGASLALALFALKFDPKVVKVVNISAGSFFATNKSSKFTQLIDPSGMCMISVSNLNGAVMADGSTLLVIEVEAVAPGDAGFLFDQDAMHIVATDAQDVVLDAAPVRLTVK